MAKYKMTLTMDCQSSGKSYESVSEGEDVVVLKGLIEGNILSTLESERADSGEYCVEMLIEKNGEYYDHDEHWLEIDDEYSEIVYLED